MQPDDLAAAIALEWKALLEPLVARVVALEAQAPIPGPPGPAGADGKDGAPGPTGEKGLDGKDGQGFTLRGPYREATDYKAGDIVLCKGLWYCNRPTTGRKPGDASGDWTLVVKGDDLRGGH